MGYEETISPYTTQRNIAPKAQPKVTLQLYRKVTLKRSDDDAQRIVATLRRSPQLHRGGRSKRRQRSAVSGLGVTSPNF